jgi:2-keto-4-pentenoate hydratase
LTFDPALAANALHEARLARRPAGPLPADIAPRTEAEGIAVQLALAHRLGAMPPGGFKIGATTRKMQEYLGLSGPVAGFMAAASLHASPATLPWPDLRNPGLECEIGVRLGRDLSAGEDPAGAVGELFAAIEIVENRYGPPPAGDLKAVGTPTLIADQVFHRAAVLGEPVREWRSLDLAAVQGRIFVDGVVRGEGLGAELLGHPMKALTWLAGSAEVRAFGGLKAGQVVMLGSVATPVWVDGPCGVTVAFAGMGEVRLRLT